jgi:hypothetical protein
LRPVFAIPAPSVAKPGVLSRQAAKQEGRLVNGIETQGVILSDGRTHISHLRPELTVPFPRIIGALGLIPD